jgi:CubicO group peptidase (beta-lactamase class C family)
MQTVQPESVGLSSVRLARIQPVMQDYIDRREFAGVITAVSRRGQAAHLAKVGWQEIENERPMSFDTIFRIYSMSKPITSAAVMMLCEEGKVRLVDPVSRYIPGFKHSKVMVARNGCDYDLVPAKREITVHDLFTHSSGLSYGFDQQSALDDIYRKELFKRMEKDSQMTLEELITILARLPLAFHPGTAFRYSFSIDVLGYIIQVISGMPFEDFLQERVFAPLGMVDTAFWVPPEKRDRLAAIYGPAKEGGLKPLDEPLTNRYLKPPRNPSGGGGLVSTVSDYLRFGQMLLNLGELDGARLLGRKTVQWMLQNHLPEGIPANGNPANGFGLGGAVLLHPGLSHRPGSVGRFGWGGAANTEWWIDPAEDLQCLLMTQYMPGFTIPIVEDFAQLAYQALE